MCAATATALGCTKCSRLKPQKVKVKVAEIRGCLVGKQSSQPQVRAGEHERVAEEQLQVEEAAPKGSQQ